MCRVLKVVLVAPEAELPDLRKALSALDYDVVAAFASVADVDLDADVAVVTEPAPADVEALRARGLKVATVGGAAGDLVIDPADVRSFRTRVWELFRP